MKIKIDKNILQFFAMSLVIIVLGVSLIIFFQEKQVQLFGTGMILSGIIITVMGLYVSTKPKYYFIKDERHIRINEKAGHQAFLIIIIMICIIYSIDLFWKLNILFKDIAPLLFIIGIYSWFILKWHYGRKGE
ncbi:MAG: DUF2178 domain-containing protein [Candidatus Aenigmarchaeota archaeon]|nr:DUF2178 domain-containing protein [Candidatus Aenigmarchaeota archaeon]